MTSKNLTTLTWQVGIYIYKLERYALRKVIRSSQDQASSMNQCFLGDSGITLIWGN